MNAVGVGSSANAYVHTIAFMYVCVTESALFMAEREVLVEFT